MTFERRIFLKGSYEAKKLSDHVYWVGANDWALRDFHGYLTGRGTTYNAYLILADKITLIDTVETAFKEEMLSRIASVIEPREICYVISQHAEMDHSGSLPEFIETIKPEKVIASAAGVKALSEHFHWNREVVAVKDGDNLSLGNLNLSFTETRMLHWPESMFTYLIEDAILFSQDAFGMHLASSERFADELPDEIVEYEGAKYFANILLPYSALVIKLLEKLGQAKLSPTIIAPAHGPIWRRDLQKILLLYSKWASQKPTRKAVVVYDTMWQSTALMARAIGEGLITGGASAKLMPIGPCHRSDVATELLDAGAFLVGTPVLNGNMLPTIADVLTYLKGLKPRNLIGAAFGSYGWSGEAIEEAKEILAAMKVELIGDALKVKYVPDAAALAQCHSL
jgi:flavorubredoxin